MLWIKRFIRPHDGDEIFGLGEVDDVVRVAGEHLNGGDFFAGHFKFDDFAAADSALLNQTVTGNDDENLGLGVVPVLAADDAGAEIWPAFCVFSSSVKTPRLSTCMFRWCAMPSLGR